MIREFTLLPVTEQSHPFCATADCFELARYGYREEEYLFTGTANVYGTGPDEKPRVLYSDVPYTNRLIVRRPENAAACSGKVVVEIINSTANIDIERVWCESRRWLMRHGHIFVGITSKPNVFAALRRCDPQRYGPLNWPNPAAGTRPVVEPEDPICLLGEEDQEMGLIWDMLRELPALLKSGEGPNPLADCPAKAVYLTGWSQSCSYINRLVNSFVYPDRKPAPPLYNGYLPTGSVCKLTTPLNRYECNDALPLEKRLVTWCPVPFIELNTESENSNLGGFGGYDGRRPDSDAPGFLYRHREVTGSCHDSAANMGNPAFADDIIAARVFPMRKGAPMDPTLNDYPKHYAFHAALRDLMLWDEQGIAPAKMPPICQTADGLNEKDAFGNTLGGMRTPQLELPAVRYCSFGPQPRPDGTVGINYLRGHVEPFSPALLRELYGNAAQYRARAEAFAAKEVQQGMLLAEDAAEAVDEAVDAAVRRGLPEV